MRRAAARVEPLERRTLLSTWHVSAAAATAGDGSAASPFRTIQQAANVVNAGDFVNVGPGTYVEVVTVSRSGTAAGPITFRKAPGASGSVNVTSHGLAAGQQPSHAKFNGVINVTGDHLVFDGLDVRGTPAAPGSTFFGYRAGGTVTDRVAGLTIRNAYTANTLGSGIYVARADGVSLHDNKVENACKSTDAAVNSQECITVTEVDGFEIAGNEVWSDGVRVASNGGEGIDAKGSSRNGVIRDNLVRDLSVEIGIYLDSGSRQGTDPAVDAVPMENIVVTRNTVANGSSGVILSSERGGTVRNVTITNNVLYDNGEHGIALVNYADTSSPTGSDGPRQNILIANNTVFRNGFRVAGANWGGGINVGTANAADVRILNNVVSGNEAWQIGSTVRTSTGGDQTVPAGAVVARNNLSFGTAYSYWDPILGSNPVTADPQYVSAGGPSAAPDLRLRPTSPAINGGTTGEAPAVDRLNRPRYGNPDAGAYEFVPAAPGAIALALASDTGVAGDGRTRLNNASLASALTFSVAGTLAGATVRLFAGPTLVGTATASGATAAVTTSGTNALADGPVTITATQTFAGALSHASEALTVTVDTTAPTLVGVPVINAGTNVPASRSQVRAITWTFSEPLAIGLGQFTLTNRGTGAAVNLASRAVVVSGNGATLELDRYGLDRSAQLFLADGNYELALSHGVTDAAGNALDANGDRTPGETPRLRFFKLLGDFTGDRRVTNADYLVWQRWSNVPVGPAGADAALDLSGNGFVSSSDHRLWMRLYNHRLAPLGDGLTFL